MVVFVKQLADGQEWRGGTAQFMGRSAARRLIVQEIRPHHRAGCLPRDRRATLLNEVVAAEILPRLAQVRRGMNDSRTARSPTTTEVDTLELVRLLLDPEDPASPPSSIRCDCAAPPPTTLYIGMLSDAARHLGNYGWPTAATLSRSPSAWVGCSRWHATCRQASRPRPRAGRPRPACCCCRRRASSTRSALLILSEFFHRAGWHVAGGPVSKDLDAATMVRQTWFDVAGFSIGSEDRVEQLGPNHQSAPACVAQSGHCGDGRWAIVPGAARTGGAGRRRHDSRQTRPARSGRQMIC